MSKTASIDIVLSSQTKSNLDVIKALLEFKWTFNDCSFVSFLPLGDDDDFDWQRESMSDVELIDLLRKKESSGEMIGVVMTWKDTNIGGEMLFRVDKSISFNLSINRKTLEHDFDITDVNWYLEKIIPAISHTDLVIESIAFSEHV